MNQQQAEFVQTAIIYSTVKQFCARHQAFTIGGMRALVFNENNNGLARTGAIVRVGRKVLIDEGSFFVWVKSQNGGAK